MECEIRIKKARTFVREVLVKDRESIIDNYRESDPEERLHLFLDNPTLRNAFVGVELESVVSAETTGPRATPHA